ncbi:hypothetical protein APHAL10511_005473 [Amanita phalloides]|nr:hypothetical protein APHAL10511_005473 [Amanita phalloides]
MAVDTSVRDDEEPFLLPEEPFKSPGPTPLPLRQFSILFLLQHAEFLTSNTTYPFMPDLIRRVGITNGDEKKVGYYVGLLQTIFFAAATATSFHCCQLSDRIGRKPILLVGMMGLSLSMCAFGLSTTFWALLLWQCIIGLFYGTTGVMKSMLVDMTDSTNIAKAWAYTTLTWYIASGLGSTIGGSLSRPADQFPRLFGSNEFLKKYPYFLPSAVCAVFLFLSCLVGIVFLRETTRDTVSLASLFKTEAPEDEAIGLLSLDGGDTPVQEAEDKNHGRPLSLREILTPKVIIVATNYAALSLVDIAYWAIQPVFLSTPIASGGLGLSPPAIGTISTIYAIFAGLSQSLCFARVHDKFGSRKVFMFGVAMGLPTYLLWPVMSWIAKRDGYSGWLWFVLSIQVCVTIIMQLAFGSILILVAQAPQNRASLGATIGFCQMAANIVRAIGPAAFNSLFSLSIDNGYLGGQLIYVVLILIVGMALATASLVP